MTNLAQVIKLPGPNDSQVTVEGIRNFKFASVASIITTAIPFVFAFAGIGLLLMLLASGFSYLTSAGDAKKLEQARQKLTYALVGFLVIFIAYWLVQIAGVIFGIPEFGTIFK